MKKTITQLANPPGRQAHITYAPRMEPTGFVIKSRRIFRIKARKYRESQARVGKLHLQQFVVRFTSRVQVCSMQGTRLLSSTVSEIGVGSTGGCEQAPLESKAKTQCSAMAVVAS